MILSKSKNIERQILSDIYSGRYVDRLPSEKKLAKLYKTTPVTAAKILNRLKDKKIVDRISGRGTFIKPGGLCRKVKLCLSFLDEMMEKIKLELKRLFPETEIEFVEKGNKNILELMEETDIIYLTSYFPDSRDKYFAPLPENLINEAQNDDKYYSGAFMTHYHNNSYYAVPCCASPCVLAYNKELFQKYFAPNAPASLSLNDLLNINEKLKDEDIALIDCNGFMRGTVIDFIFSQMPEREVNRRNLNNTSWEHISSGFEKLDKLLNDSINKKADFKKGKAVFTKLCRQTMIRRYPDLDFAWDVIPASFGRNRLSISASESLAVSANAENKEKLFEICRAFLEPSIQDIIGKYKYGVPILKSSALKSMDSHQFRDDVFFNEMKNVVFKYELFELPLMNLFKTDVEDYFKSKISFENFFSKMEKLYALNEKNFKAKGKLTNEYTY
jgi:ABC-type glycerol-3-phosphate transport system substrate-binding protein